MQPKMPEGETNTPSARGLSPLYAAGFTTAFGAHSIAGGLGAETHNLGLSILTLGVLLALYDIAEVILKPVFGALSDRIGVRPLIVGGLVLFAAASLVGVWSDSPIVLGLSRLGQGAAASAFSPASSAAVARLAGPAAAGRYFGRYGSWKALGYAIGPLLGAGLITVGGFPALFVALALLAIGVAIWVLVAVPQLPVLPRPHYTVADLIRQVTNRSFLLPTAALACATGALGVAVGFLPLLGATLGSTILASMAAVTVLALASSLIQPIVGRLRDADRITTKSGLVAGLLLTASGITLLALVPSPVTLYVAALVIGLGIGIATPIGFAHLAATTPPERMGRTMGAAELGRELGDAGGPLLVGAIATVTSVSAGLGTLAVILGVTSALCATLLRTPLARSS